jgi:hypothetical protein
MLVLVSLPPPKNLNARMSNNSVLVRIDLQNIIGKYARITKVLTSSTQRFN